MDIDSNLKENIELIDNYIKYNLELYRDNIIYRPLEYSLFSGGKRIRPILNMESFRLFNKEDSINNTLPLALLIEFIHSYSLVHDDLPAMDNDDYRRGVYSTHKKYGEAIGILAGDALLNTGIEICINRLLDLGSEYLIRGNKAMAEIIQYAGINGMIGGQVLDIELEGKSSSKDEIIEMYEKKTAALIQASLVSGAIMANAAPKEIELIRDYGKYLGMSYQLQDDVLDLVEDEEINKTTIASVLGIDKSKELANFYIKKSEEVLNKLEYLDIEFFKSLHQILIGRKY